MALKSWQEDQIQELLTTQCEQKLFDKLVTISSHLGFDYCAYGLRAPLPVSNPKIVMVNNYPIAWQTQYQDKDYLSIDPTVHHGMRSSLPIIWSDDLFSSAREFWEDAHSYGLRVGWSQSSRDERGIGGLLTVARSYEPLSKEEISELVLRMAWLTQLAHLGMSKCLTTKLLPETEIQLTDREKSVLRWTADGKTSSEISEMLNISGRTVNFHINNAVKKLGTPNKLAATLKAAVLGML